MEILKQFPGICVSPLLNLMPPPDKIKRKTNGLLLKEPILL